MKRSWLPALSIILTILLGGLGFGFLSKMALNEFERESSHQRSAKLKEGLAKAKSGDVILLVGGIYEGDIYVEYLKGEPERPIIIGAADPLNPPIIKGGREGMHLVDPAYVEIRDIIFSGARDNGLNIDDGVSYDTPASHILLRNLKVIDVGPDGNKDCIKLSGVDNFTIVNCTIECWGSDGSAIDLVGCHDGYIEACVFRNGDDAGASGIQVKGGSCNITIRACWFEHAGLRAVNIGGSTDLQYFRPQPPQGYEAKDILVERCVFIGSEAPVAFVGVDGAVVRFNTIYRPKRWIMRKLQETLGPDFAMLQRRFLLQYNCLHFKRSCGNY
ncbi:MAG: right-handed parallel beta-helix repeat-containing protein [Thermoproteota archaeon]